MRPSMIKGREPKFVPGYAEYSVILKDEDKFKLCDECPARQECNSFKEIYKDSDVMALYFTIKDYAGHPNDFEVPEIVDEDRNTAQIAMASGVEPSLDTLRDICRHDRHQDKRLNTHSLGYFTRYKLNEALNYLEWQLKRINSNTFSIVGLDNEDCEVSDWMFVSGSALVIQSDYCRSFVGLPINVEYKLGHIDHYKAHAFSKSIRIRHKFRTLATLSEKPWFINGGKENG